MNKSDVAFLNGNLVPVFVRRILGLHCPKKCERLSAAWQPEW